MLLAQRTPRSAIETCRRTLAQAVGANPRATLGVPWNADIDECKAAFRTLALSLHPDVSPTPSHDAVKFAAVIEAFETIEQGRAVDSRHRGPRGVRIVGGMLVVSIEALKSDPGYEVHTVRVRFEEVQDDMIESAGATGSSHPGVASDALSTETVVEVQTSAWDSVADLRMLLQETLGLPDGGRGIGGKQLGAGRHELIYRGQLLGEHLFLGPDYGVADGDELHFAAIKNVR